VLLAVALYGNTLGHRYALDDSLFITENAYTKRGIQGLPDIFGHDSFRGYFKNDNRFVSGGRYRPLSIATFALEYQLAGPHPGLSHGINVALYGITGALLYALLLRLLPPTPRARWWASPPFLVTALFLTHPLHTEVVANIKGRDEILALLLGLGAFGACLIFLDSKRERRAWWLLAASASMFLALLAKESVIPLLVMIPVGLWFFRRPDARRIAFVAGALLVSAVGYLVLRAIAAGPLTVLKSSEILNDPFVGATAEQRFATVLETIGIYLRLFVVPHPLSHDYYYNQVPWVGFWNPAALIPLGIVIVLAVVAARGIGSRSPIAFGLLFFAATFSIVSNLWFTPGTMMAERWLYIPSLGLTIATVYALQRNGPRESSRGAAILILGVALLFSAMTIARNAAWKDNLTLFSTDVKVAPRSAKLQTALGGTLIETAETQNDPRAKEQLLREAIAHLTQAIQIYPTHAIAWNLRGIALYDINPSRTAEALADFRRSAELDPERASVFKNIALALEREAKPDSAIEVCEEYLRRDPAAPSVWAAAGRLYAQYRGDYTKAADCLERALALDGNDRSIYEDLGVAQALSGRTQSAIETMQRGIARFGHTATLDRNLAMARRAADSLEVGRKRQVGH
jgi:tetratricopeptide (TPR) repeat protein